MSDLLPYGAIIEKRHSYLASIIRLVDEVEGPTEFLVDNNGHVGNMAHEAVDCPKVLYTSK